MEQRTKMDDLELNGHELSEEHLRLASGGMPKLSASLTYKGKWDFELDL
jgi:hypothetical protein